ncbi:twin-arginine translocase subunit TatC [bacterium]|nr:twin-arginine translocase subunit TatC [bacterium]
MTLLQHLEELRGRLILSVVFLLVGALLGFLLAKPAVGFLVRPFSNIVVEREEKLLRVRVDPETGVLRVLDPVGPSLFEEVSPYRLGFYLPGTPEDSEPDLIWGQNLQRPIFLNPLDPITLYFKAAMIVGLMLALPFILHQLWLFICPGLTRKERTILMAMLGLACLLFPAGALFAYFMFSFVLNFLVNFQVMNMEAQLEVFRFINLELRLMLGFGTVFEMPLLVMLLTFLGIIHPRQLRQYRPHVIVGIAIVSMAFTPPDPFSMLLMMCPLIILYEISIWASIPLARRRATKEEA